MKAEVKTLIGTLTTERNRIDLAISALKAMDETSEPIAAAKKVKTRAGGKRGQQIDASIKAQAAARMSVAAPGDLRATATRIGRELGISGMTIYTSWHRWAKNLPANGQMPTPEPELVGVQ